MLPEDDIANIVWQLLLDLELGTDPVNESDWPIYVNTKPTGAEVPDNIIVIYTTDPEIQEHLQVGEVQENPSFQIMTRCEDGDLPAGYIKHRNIARQFAASIKNTSVTVDANIYNVIAIIRRSGPLFVGREQPESDRFLHTSNYAIAIEQTA